MVLDFTLDQVLADYKAAYPQSDPERYGVNDDEIVSLLRRHHLRYARSGTVWLDPPGGKEPAILTVPSLNYAGLLHYVVWDGKQYLDPAPEGKLRYPDDGPTIADEKAVCWASCITWSEQLAPKRYAYISARAEGRLPATVGGKEAGWRGTVDVPTFALDVDIQGIRDRDHAERIARRVIDPLGLLNVFPVVTMPGDGP
jgi:hypothetical protein